MALCYFKHPLSNETVVSQCSDLYILVNKYLLLNRGITQELDHIGSDWSSESSSEISKLKGTSIQEVFQETNLHGLHLLPLWCIRFKKNLLTNEIAGRWVFLEISLDHFSFSIILLAFLTYKIYTYIFLCALCYLKHSLSNKWII